MTIYLGYVQGGKCKDTHAVPEVTKDSKGVIRKRYPQTFKQFWVIDELSAMGVRAWCGRRIDFYRTGKDRYAEAHESPFLPNYLFIDMNAEQFYPVTRTKHLLPGFQIVPRGEEHHLDTFKDAVDADYSAAQRVEANSQAAVAEYTEGQRIRATTGPFKDFDMWFSRVVKKGHDKWPRIEALVDMMGRKAAVQFDPLDVRKL